MTIRITMTPDGPKATVSAIGPGVFRFRFGPWIIVLRKWGIDRVRA